MLVVIGLRFIIPVVALMRLFMLVVMGLVVQGFRCCDRDSACRGDW